MVGQSSSQLVAWQHNIDWDYFCIFGQVLPISPKFGTEFQNVSSKDGGKTLPVDVPDCNQRSNAVADVVGAMAAE